MSLKEFLGFLEDSLQKRGLEIPILVDFRAFKEEAPDAFAEESDLYDLRVKVPGAPSQLTLGAALRVVLAQIPTDNATFVVRRGVIHVTTVTHAAPRNLVAEKVDVVFERRPLAAAVQELSELTGASINIDPRIGDKRYAPITATYANDVSVQTALSQLADMVGGQVILLEEGLYITTAEHAEALRKEALRKERKALHREKLWRKRNGLASCGELLPGAYPSAAAGTAP
jgi:hypothetical protein